MPAWVHDEAIWEKAKARVREQYPKVSEDEDQFYALTTAIYKKMGGQVRTAKCLLSFGKAHIKGHYRTDPTTGRPVYVKPHEDARLAAAAHLDAPPGLSDQIVEQHTRPLKQLDDENRAALTKPDRADASTMAPAPAMKEPWQMTRIEHLHSLGHDLSRLRSNKKGEPVHVPADAVHAVAVADAVALGKPVPATVLADYPDLIERPAAVPKDLIPLAEELVALADEPQPADSGVSPETWQNYTATTMMAAVYRHFGVERHVQALELIKERLADAGFPGAHPVKDLLDAYVAQRGDLVTPRTATATPDEAFLRSFVRLDKAKLDAYNPSQAVAKSGRQWGYITTDGNPHPGRYDTRREAVEAAARHKELKLSQYADPTSYFDVTQLLASESLKLIEQYESAGMTEMEAGKKAHAEIERLYGYRSTVEGYAPIQARLPEPEEPWDMDLRDFIAEQMRGKTISRTLPTYKYNQEVERAKALYGEHIRQALEAGKPVPVDVRHWSGYKSHLLKKEPEAVKTRGPQLDLFKAVYRRLVVEMNRHSDSPRLLRGGLRRLGLFFKGQLKLPLHDEKVPVEGHMRGSAYVAPHQATRHKKREKSDEPEKPKALAAPEREKYPDGRLKPIDGDQVWQLVPGFGGTPAYIYGEVSRRGNALRVRITGSASLIGGGVAGPKTVALSPHWTVEGDPRIKEREAERERERREAEATRQAEQATQQQEARRRAAASLQRALDRGERAPTREDVQQGAWVKLHEPATGETKDIIVYRVEEREPKPPQVLYREQGGVYPIREAEPGKYRATMEAQYAMPLSHVLEVGTVEPGQDVDGQWAAEVRQREADAEAYEREERERHAKYEQDRATDEARTTRLTQLEARIKAAVRRYKQDGGRAIQWAWDAMSAEERANMDTLLVDIEHPLAREAGTAESRFRTLVQDVLREKGLLKKSLLSTVTDGLLLSFGKAKNPDLIPKPTQVSGHERTVGGVTHWISPHASTRYTRPASPFTKIGTRHDVSFDEIRDVAGQAEQQWPESYNAKLMGVLMHPHVYAIWEKQNRTTTAPRYGFAHRVRQVRNDRYGPGYVVEQVAKTPKGESVAPWNSLRDDYYSHHPDTAWSGISRNTKHQFVVDLYMLAHGADAELIERESRPLWDAMRHGLKLVRSRAIPEGYGVGDRIQRADDSVHTVVGGQDGYLVLEDEQGERSLLSPEAVIRGDSIKLSPLQKAHVKTYTRKDGTLVREHEDARRSAQPEVRRPRRRGEDQTASLEHRPSAEFVHERMKRYGYVQHEGRWVKTPAQTSEQPTPMTTPQPAVQPVTPADPGHLDSWLEEINQAPDIQAAMREVLEGTPTVHLHRLEDGTYTPERTRLHESIIASMLNPRAVVAEGQRPQAVVFLGRPGSGKTSALGPAARDLGVEFTTINADDVKAKLPEYTGRNAGLVHEESSDIAEGLLFRKALDAGHHVILDITGGNQQKVEGMVDRFHRAGYEISIMFADLPLEKACARVVDRFRRTGRFVPPSYVAANVDHKPDRTYNALKEDPRVSHWRRYNTDVAATQTSALQEEGRRPGGHASSEPGAHAFSKSAAAGDALTRGPDRRALRAHGGDPERQDHGDARPLSQPPALATILTHSAALQRTLCKSLETLDQDLRSPELDPASRGVLLAERLTQLERLEALQARLQEVGV